MGGAEVCRSGSSWSVPWAGATTRGGHWTARRLRENVSVCDEDEDEDDGQMRSVLSILLIICLGKGEASSFLAWNKASGQQIDAARTIGVQARREYSQSVKLNGLSRRDRQLLYLDGLQKCNSIDDELIADIDRNVVRRNYRKLDADALERIGLNRFFAAFVTLPAIEMKKVVNFACAKHEQQLECGVQYEGEAKTNQRIAELMQDGGNRQMFEHECVEEDYATTVYPCLGRTGQWIGACEKEISEYTVLRRKVNNKIESVYNAAIQTVKSLKEDQEQVFSETMRFINYAEGSKCLAFKKMRVCLLQQLVSACGVETARALNTSISVGYLASERSDRLQSDFDTFAYPSHPFCEKL
ncbi:unnamed protein product [Caenorhabditis sp. 36 PRJEB53466]|nr:unnamed protein product [Caenorhabditis sp. 36 PRJEB53466]